MTDIEPLDIPGILDKAADVIETRGWWHGSFMPNIIETDPDTCPVCVLGAMKAAAGLHPSEGDLMVVAPTALVFADYLGIEIEGTNGYNDLDDALCDLVGGWNDDGAKSAEGVINRLRSCAAAYRAKHPTEATA